MSLARYSGCNIGMFDLSKISEMTWNSTQGQPLVYTEVDGPISRLSWHLEFIHLLIVTLVITLNAAAIWLGSAEL